MTTRCFALSMFFLCLLGMTACKEKEKSQLLNHPHNIRGVVSLKHTFGDELEEHLAAAKKLGVRPIDHKDDILRLGNRVKEVKSCSDYQVDAVKGSLPYLVPKAQELLKDVGKNFLDSLSAKGLNANRISVRTMLQPTSEAECLPSSSKRKIFPPHCYATTFDVSGNVFHKVEGPDSCFVQDVRSDTLQLVLSEVLRDLKKADRCHIYYQLTDDCFQITAR